VVVVVAKRIAVYVDRGDLGIEASRAAASKNEAPKADV